MVKKLITLIICLWAIPAFGQIQLNHSAAQINSAHSNALAITDTGSGQIITVTERGQLGSIITSAERTKLSGIEPLATTDQTDGEIETAYNNQVSVVSQADAEAGVSTAVRRWTPERVGQAIAALAGGGTDDQVASEVPFTPNGSIASTNVQAAIQEVRDEAGGSGDVVGPASSTQNAIPLYNDTTGKVIRNSSVTVDPATGDITTPGSVTGSEFQTNAADGAHWGSFYNGVAITVTPTAGRISGFSGHYYLADGTDWDNMFLTVEDIDTQAEFEALLFTLPSGGDNVSINGSTVTDPDFVSTGDITFTDTAGTITADINAGVIVNADINSSAAISMSKTAFVAGTDLTLTGDTLTISPTIARDTELHDALTIGTANGLSLSTQALSMAAASTTAVGTVELATGAEAVTGTDTTRAVTPDNLTDRMASPGTIGGTTPGAINGTTGTYTGTLSGEIGVTLDTAATIDLSTASNARGQMRINNDNDVIDYTLPPAEAGLNICFYSRYAAVVTIDVDDTADTIILDGTALTAGYAIDSPGTAGDFICMMAIDGTYWLTLGRSGTWVDGGAD